jgi:FtsZ-binding cell division protein ZapB
VMAAIRISLIIVALGIVGLVVLTFWKQIGIIKIGSSGIEFGKFDEFSSKTEAELAAKNARIEELEAENALLRRQKKELQKRIKAMYARKKGTKNE